jgi:hypothetical protein
MDPNLSEIEATTLQEIFPRVLEDNFFLDYPLLAYLRDHCRVPWGGGAYQQTAFRYAPMTGTAYQVGENFNLTKPQTIAGLVFDLKNLEVNVTEFMEVLDLNRGPAAVFNLVKEDLENAVQTANAMCDNWFYRHGQAAGGLVIDNRLRFPNGASEALDDGITSSWDGNVYTRYGGQLRNGAIATALNSIPYWAGSAAGAPGMLTYNVLEETYQDASHGRFRPDLGLTNKAAYAYGKERIQAAQRFAQEEDPIWGHKTWHFEQASILVDEYCPSLRYGRNDPVLGNSLTAAFTSSAAPAASSNLPAATVVTPAEVFFWLHTPSIEFRVSTHPMFGFQMTPFKVAQNNTRVAAQLLARLNFVFTSCRYGKVIYGIGA